MFKYFILNIVQKSNITIIFQINFLIDVLSPRNKSIST